MRITTPKENEQINLHTEAQIKYFAEDRSDYEIGDFDYLNLRVTLQANGIDDSKSGFVHFEWEPAVDGKLELSEDSDFSDSLVYSGVGACEVSNLKIGTKYYARVKNEEETSPVLTFSTERICPRMIRVDGISNVRDMGGYVTRDGRTIKQGLFYRGSELHNRCTITEEGLLTMREVLKIKSELDLRNQNEEKIDVYKGNYVNILIPAYKTFLERPECSRQIIDFMADEANYPIYAHCAGGADRTGTLVFLLGLILGVSYEQLIDDYECTSLSIFGPRSRNKEIFKTFVDLIEEMEGADLHEKAYNYFLSCGIEREKLEKIKNLFLE